MTNDWKIHTRHPAGDSYPSTVKRAARQFAREIAAPCGTIEGDDIGSITVERNSDDEIRLTIRRK